MIIYGTKLILLKSIELPVECSDCGNDLQRLYISRKFISLFFIPLIPLTKQAFLSCPRCGSEMKIKQFLKSLAEKVNAEATAKAHLKTLIRETRTPLWAFIAPALALTFILTVGFLGYLDQQAELKFTQSFAKKPFENVVVLYKDDADIYPYHIAFVSQIEEKNIIFSEWDYDYQNLREAKRGFLDAARSLRKDKTLNFSSSFTMPLSEFLKYPIESVRSIETEID